MPNLKPGTRLTHQKGMPYQFLFYARHSESLEELAIYECLYKNPGGAHWARPRAMFEDTLVKGDGSKVERFATLQNPQGKPTFGLGMSAAQAAAAASRFNARAWEELDKWQELDPWAKSCVLEKAMASLLLWREIGGDATVARGHWFVARILMNMAQLEGAWVHVTACVKCTEISSDAEDFDRAYAAEAEARLASLQNAPEAVALKAKALTLGEAIHDPENRAIFLSDFGEGPW